MRWLSNAVRLTDMIVGGRATLEVLSPTATARGNTNEHYKT
jgi:hypothetical protein